MNMSENLYEVLSTTRSIRKFTTQDIDDATLHRVLQAAIWAPSGGNRQPWRIIAVKDPQIKKQLGDIYSPEWDKYVDMNMQKLSKASDAVKEAAQKGFGTGTQLARNLADVPVVCIFVHNPTDVFTTDAHLGRTPVVGGASLYPAVQNLLLAARAEGLGGVLTTLIAAREPEVRAVLNIPEPWGVHAMVPLGYPQGKHGPLRRAPLSEMVKFDTWS